VGNYNVMFKLIGYKYILSFSFVDGGS